MTNPITQWLRRYFATSEEIKNGSCKQYGHDYQKRGIHGYYTSGVPGFALSDSWKVYRKDYYKCSKCGSPDFRNVTVGRVSVDTDTDELSVKQ